MNTSTDRIERSILLKAPRQRVWRALTDAREFGAWFGVNLEGHRFVPGQRTQARINIPGFEHVMFDVHLERMDEPSLFSWRWVPAAVERGVDYSSEPTTLVEFTLEETEGGTLLSVVESGFDRVPPHRRLNAFRMNSDGWSAQVRNIAKHVVGTQK